MASITTILLTLVFLGLVACNIHIAAFLNCTGVHLDQVSRGLSRNIQDAHIIARESSYRTTMIDVCYLCFCVQLD
jgi:hypothetical protein